MTERRLLDTAPCDLCGTTGGARSRPGEPPRRIGLRRFGRDGQACWACYRRLGRASGTDGKPPAEAPPCDLCGTAGGAAIPGRGRQKAARFKGEAYGVEGLICRECRDDLVDEAIDRRTMALGIDGRVALVREAKAAKARDSDTGWDVLTAEELDAVMPDEGRGGVWPPGRVG